MNVQTEAALRASIEHWKENLMAETFQEVNIGILNCPLCKIFWADYCVDCPVFLMSKQKYCEGTPYYSCSGLYSLWRAAFTEDGKIQARTAFRAAAKDEIDFLESLLPIGYAVESEREPGSVQIYPESALEALENLNDD